MICWASLPSSSAAVSLFSEYIIILGFFLLC